MLLGQWVLLCGWTWSVYDSWNVHVDFATRSQAVYGILHGNWNPMYTVVGWPHLADHFDLSIYPLAFLTLLWPHLLWLFIVQVTLLVAAEYGALRVVDVFTGRPWWPDTFRRGTALWLLAALFCLNPFLVWAVGSDVHLHMFGAVCGAVFVLLFFLRGSWGRMALAVTFTLLFGDLAPQILVVLGLSLGLTHLHRREARRAAAAIVVAAAAWWSTVGLLGAGAGSELGIHYGYLIGTSRHQISPGQVLSGMVGQPGAAVGRLPSALGSMWGALSIGGLIGLFTPLSLPLVLNGTETGLGVQSWVGWPYPSHGSMAEMPWQLLPILVLEPLLTVVAIAWLQRAGARFGRRVAAATKVVVVLLVANALLWTVVWLPRVLATNELTPPATVAVLDRVQRDLPPSDEVVASLGVIGRLGDRRYLHATVFGSADTVVPLETPDVDFVITPVTGQEPNSVDAPYLTSYLLGQPNARLVVRRANVWLIRYHRLPGQHRLVVHYGSTDVAGAALPTPSGARTGTGWPERGCLWAGNRTGDSRGTEADSSTGTGNRTGTDTGTDAGGFLFTSYRNALRPGRYLLQMTLDGTTPMKVEVGDDDTHRLLAGRQVRRVAGLHSVSLPFTVTDAGRIPVAYGWGPYRLTFPVPQQDDIIETRLWSGGGGPRAVCSVSIRPVL